MEENKIREILYNILNDIDDEILEFNGENLIDEGLIDSFAIISIMSMIEDKMGISISPDDVKEENFKSVDAIVKLIVNSQ